MKKILISFLSVVASIVSTITVKAVSYQLPVSNQAPTVSGNNPGGIVYNFYLFALFISGILAFGAIVYGGIKYAISAGNPSGQSEGIDWIKGALWGILLLAAAYLILKTINPALVNLTVPAL